MMAITLLNHNDLVEAANECSLDTAQGVQVAYIPVHAHDDIKHPDVEFGFITGVKPGVAYVRYWSKAHRLQLRTTSCSERTPIERLILFSSVPQEDVVRHMVELEYWESESDGRGR